MNHKLKRASLLVFFFVCLFGGLWIAAGNTYASSYRQQLAPAPTVDDSVPDDLTQPVIIQKTDPNGAQLQDAEISVVDSNGVVQTNIVTTYDVTMLNMSKGEYFLHESGAPDGYQQAEDIWFSVNPTVDSRNGKHISTEDVQFTGITNLGGVRQDTEFGKIVYCINPEIKTSNSVGVASVQPMSVEDPEYFIVYGSKENLSAALSGSSYNDQTLNNLNSKFNYLVNQGYKKIGEPFEGMTDEQSYAATQLAIWATIQPETCHIDLESSVLVDGWKIWDNLEEWNGYELPQDDAFRIFINRLYNINVGPEYFDSEEAGRDIIIAKAKELFENAQNSDELAKTKYDHYMLYYNEQYGNGEIPEFQNLISAADPSDPIIVTMIDEPIPEEPEETPEEEQETPKKEKKTVNAQTVQTSGVQTGSAVHTMLWTMMMISAFGAAMFIKKEAE